MCTNFFGAAVAFAFASSFASSFASAATFFPPGALFSFSVEFESPEEEDAGDPAVEADGGEEGFAATVSTASFLSAVVTGPFAHAPASGLAGDEGVVEPDGVGSDGGETETGCFPFGAPLGAPFDPASVADDVFFVVAAAEACRGADAADRFGDVATSLATSEDHDPFAPTAFVSAGGTALAGISATGEDLSLIHI